MPIVRMPSKIYLSLLVATLGLIASPGVCAENGSGGGFKIGVVDTREVFDNYNKQKVEYEKLRVSVTEAQRPIDELSERITKDTARYEAEKDTMPVEDRKALEEVIESALTQYRAEFKRAQEDVDRQEKKLLRDLLEEIQMAIQEVGLKEDYHLIFESGQNNASSIAGRTGGLLYSSTTLNMTQRVIDHLNEQKQ